MDRNTAKQAIKDKIDIVELVGRYTVLQHAGKRMKGLSPFTNEKTPSFFVDPSQGVYYCFSSQKGGDIFSFVEEMEGVNFIGAFKLLAEQAGVDITTNGTGGGYTNQPYYDVLEIAAETYQKNMTDEVEEYLISRGITRNSIHEWRLGFAPESWHTLCNTNTKNINSYIQAGLCIQKEKSTYDRFRKRVQFPFFDTQDRVIAFSGRAYRDDSGAKYINSPESPLFNKSSFIYGLHKAKMHIRKNDTAMLTEGPIDTIMAHQAGYPITVAVSGTAVTDRHLRQLQQLSNRLLIAFDGDAAGTRATFRVISMAFSFGMELKVVLLPGGKDPADLIHEDLTTFKEAVRGAVSAITFIIQHIKVTYGETGEDIIRGVKEKLLPIIIHIKDPLTKEYAIKETALLCSLSEEAIKKSVETLQEKDQIVREERSGLKKKVSTIEKKESSETRLKNFSEIVAMAISFLSHNKTPLGEEIVQILEEIQTLQHLPEIDEKVAIMRYEENFPDEKSRADGVKIELKDMAQRLVSELKKSKQQEELNKKNNFSL